jgi:hypothetical protein
MAWTRRTHRAVRTLFVTARLAALVAGLVAGPATSAYAISGGGSGCPGSVNFVPYRVVRLSAGYQAYFPQRRVDRSPCYAGRQIVTVTYREFTGFPDATRWTLQETGPGANAPASWYLPGQYFNVPPWNGGFFTKDMASVDILIQWFTDSWVPLGYIYLNYDSTSDYECMSSYCRIYSSPLVGAYVYYY